MATYSLASSEDQIGLQQPPGEKGLGSVVLLHNAQWFTRVRWIVACIFIVAGVAGMLLPDFINRLGITVPSTALFILAVVLLIANVVFFLLSHRFSERSSVKAVKTNIWFQISLDLVVVTLLVHVIGSTDTFIAFTFLFHIALACIFFPVRESLLVTSLAAGLYLINLALEITGDWPATDIFTGALPVSGRSVTSMLMFAIPSVFVWFVVWYLVSNLSEAVRERDQRLSEVNERLIKANQEKNQQMLVTTHDLKAPFAGIESNIQILKYQFWDDVPSSVRTIIDRIDMRALTLRERIKDILILGDLKSRSETPKKSVPVDLKALVHDVLEELQEKAEGRKIDFNVNVPNQKVVGDREQFAILFSNLVANAISYSNEGGSVEVDTEYDAGDICVRVRDHGIGIREDALPHIFDEYFRTNEAAKFNRLSTGLGLAIVKVIAQNYSLGIRVNSELGKGTEFEVIMKLVKNRQIEED